MSRPVVQVTPIEPTEKVEIVEPKEHPGYYIVDDQKVDAEGNPYEESEEKSEETPEEEAPAPAPVPETKATASTTRARVSGSSERVP